jgi:hypothetical protein
VPRLRRILLITAVTVLVAVTVALVWAARNPLRRPEAEIRADLLREAPLGSSTAQVETMIRRHGWKLSGPLANTGFYDQRTRPARETGAQHLRASLGDYQDIPWEANVTVFWGFDQSGRLMDIWVWKTWDSL